MQVGEDYSFRETAVRAREAGLTKVSDVALMKRLRRAGGWFRWMCVCRLQERGWEAPEPGGWRIRLLDGTLGKGPGPGGRSWRVHYSLVIPGLECDYVELTPPDAAGSPHRAISELHTQPTLSFASPCRFIPALSRRKRLPPRQAEAPFDTPFPRVARMAY
jgi:hypothetical protein